jgi:hypothetical protein
MPQLQRNDRARRGSCPDNETFFAFAENRTRGVVRDAIAAHLSECPACAELHQRLVNFARPPLPLDDRGWGLVEMRLENAMGASLRAQARRTQSDAKAAEELAAAAKPSGWNWWYSWKVQWALGAVATLGLLVSATTLYKMNTATKRAEQTAAVVTPPAAPTPAPAAAPATLPAQQPATFNRTDAPSGNNDSGNEVAKLAEPIEDPARAPANRPLPTAPAPPQQSAESQPPPPSAGATPTETAQADGSPPPNPDNNAPDTSRTSASSPAPITHASHASAADYAPAPPVRPASPEMDPEAPANIPAVFRLEAGTRLWIRLISLHRQPDGSLLFRGTLFEPIDRSAGVSLDQGTEIAGVETTSQGRTSVMVTEFVVQAVRYTLRSPNGAKNAPKPGVGAAVQFDTNQVVETFLEATSTYEKAAGDADSPRAPR